MDFPLHLSSQLREHLRALRKARGLTQAALGELLGVRQARIAEIEANPGAVSVDQLMKLLSALRASLVLNDGVPDVAGAETPVAANTRRKPVARLSSATPAAKEPGAPSPYADGETASPPPFVIRPKKGSW